MNRGPQYKGSNINEDLHYKINFLIHALMRVRDIQIMESQSLPLHQGPLIHDTPLSVNL